MPPYHPGTNGEMEGKKGDLGGKIKGVQHYIGLSRLGKGQVNEDREQIEVW